MTMCTTLYYFISVHLHRLCHLIFITIPFSCANFLKGAKIPRFIIFIQNICQPVFMCLCFFCLFLIDYLESCWQDMDELENSIERSKKKAQFQNYPSPTKLQRDIVMLPSVLPSVCPSHPCEHSRINILQWILSKLGTYLVLKRIWNSIDFQGQKSRSPGQIFTT